MFRFANAYMLYFLILLPIIAAWFHYVRLRRQKKLAEFGDLHLVSLLTPDVSNTKPVWKFYLLLSSLAFLILGLARPQMGAKLQEVKRKGIEIMIALDVSNSMNAMDIQPSRLERAKQVLSKLIDRLEDDKIGLVVFAGEAYIQVPITADYVSAKMFLSHINTNIVQVQGTVINKALEMAAASFTPSELQKVIIVITDGEDHEGDPVELAQRLHDDKGILVYAIGMGTPEGSPIPVNPLNPYEFKKDKDGNTVITKLDEETLIKMASAGGGEYIPGNNAQAGINKLIDKLKKIDKKEYEAKIFSDYNDQFMYFFAVSLLLLFIEILVIERKSSRWANFNLFEFTLNTLKKNESGRG
ncbi:MAG: VWA domain-containing protein [Bacteroidales bacterium]|nr:VWA domain-containing protein [Bacteroidales bacterium]